MNSMQYFLETHRPEFPMKITTKGHVILEKCAKNTKLFLYERRAVTKKRFPTKERSH